jgi:hypothetical protein
VRKIRVLVVITVLAAVTSVPALAQAQIEAPAWGNGTVAERVAGWIAGLWRAVAGSETGQTAEPPADPLAGVVPDDPGTESLPTAPSTESEVFPEYDPDG